MTLKFRTKTKAGWTVDSALSPFTFPAGEAHVKIGTEVGEVEYQLADLRGADSHELFQLAMWADACKRRYEKTVLLLPYLPGARADRGIPLGARVYADFILGLHIDQIITLDPHSPFMPNAMDWGPGYLSIFPVSRIIGRELGDRGDRLHPYAGVIAPDKGATGRAQVAANKLGVPLFRAEKTRDFETGQLTGFTCETLPTEGKLLIVDDICDGGGTFIGLAEATGLPRERLDLWVTHGVFSKGIWELTNYFSMIHTTDSYPSLQAQEPAAFASYVTVHPILPYLTGDINV